MISALVVAMLAGLGIVAYAWRVARRGSARFERLDNISGSVLLSRRLVEMGYWAVNPLAKGLVRARITPDMITWAALVLGAGAGVAVALGHLGGAALLSLASVIMDILDGRVARLTKTGSDSGEVLDAAVDRYTEFFFLAGCAVYYQSYLPLMVLSLFALQACFMISYSTAKAEAMKVDPPKSVMRRHERATYLIAGSAISVLLEPWLEPLPRYPEITALPLAAGLLVVAVVGNASAVRRLQLIARALRERDRKAD